MYQFTANMDLAVCHAPSQREFLGAEKRSFFREIDLVLKTPRVES